MELFNRGYLSDFLAERVRSVISGLERIGEDEVLSRSTDDLVNDLAARARIVPITIGVDPIDGGVAEETISVRNMFDPYGGRTVRQKVFKIHAVYEFVGDQDLLYYKPQTSLAFVSIKADVDPRQGTLTVHTTTSSQRQVDANEARKAFEREIGNIRTNAEHASQDVAGFNGSLEARIRPAVENRKQHLQSRRDLAGALGFPLKKRPDAPLPVPVVRKRIGTARTASSNPRVPYRDEPALTDAQYEDAIDVVKSMIRAMERTPSVAANKDEEEIRDLILVQLNGTFEGGATGETFVKSGKTDLLVRVEDRHVFVGECKWWKGEKAFADAIDQLLGYLPWRDEKAALIVFISQKDASAVIDKADRATRNHSAFKRVGSASTDPHLRRNFVLGHPDDSEREIKLAVLFAVLSDAVKSVK